MVSYHPYSLVGCGARPPSGGFCFSKDASLRTYAYNDIDLVEPIRIVCRDIGKAVGVASPKSDAAPNTTSACGVDAAYKPGSDNSRFVTS